MHLDEELFDGYLKWLKFTDDGQEFTVLVGPGHDVSLVCCLVLEPGAAPAVIFKAGDTRVARVLRGESYVKLGSIGGRLDHSDMDASETAVAEIAEEIGGELHPQAGLVSLSTLPSPTMPNYSTEADYYFMALVRLSGILPEGDGEGMELKGLMRPQVLSIEEALQGISGGLFGEAARILVCLRRALHHLGYLPQLGCFAGELSEELAKKFQTIKSDGVDWRGYRQKGGPLPEEDPVALASQVTQAQYQVKTELKDSSGNRFLDLMAEHHTQSGQKAGASYPAQVLDAKEDETIVLCYYQAAPGQEPLVKLGSRSYPCLAAKDILQGNQPQELSLPCFDSYMGAPGLELSAEIVARNYPKQPSQHLFSCDASPGQSSLRYHLYAAPLSDSSQELLPLGEAIARCQKEGAEAVTEAALWALADYLDWIVELGLSISDALKAR